MEPNESYPLHSDQGDQSSTSRAPLVNSTDNSPLSVPSSYSPPPQYPTPTQRTTVPWYLRPLTKTTESPLTSTQTRPFVPRAPLPPIQNSLQSPYAAAPLTQPQPQPTSPFRSSSLPPIPSTSLAQPGTASQQSTYQLPSQERRPQPFSRFGSMVAPRPVETEPAKPRRLRRFIGILMAILLVGAIGAGAYSVWQNIRANNHPSISGVSITAADKERLYEAINNHLATKYVRQTYSQTTEPLNMGITKLDAISDFSDPSNPKSHILYEIKSGTGENTIDGAGEIIVRDSKEFFGKLSKPVLFYQGDESLKPKENQWYQIPISDTAGETLLDPISVRTSLNSSMGEVPVGNFANKTRQGLLKLIKDRQVYLIKKADEATLESKKMTHYDIDFNAAAANELNKKVADVIGAKDGTIIANFTKSDVRSMEIWIGHETGRIAQIKMNREYPAAKSEKTSTIKESIIVTLSYPNNATVTNKPEGAIAGPWTKK